MYAADSYGVDGPFASLRMKDWRRGIQDVDYLALAAAVDPGAVQNLVNRMVPERLGSGRQRSQRSDVGARRYQLVYQS